MKSYDDPSKAAMDYFERREQAYRFLIADKTCGDCKLCSEPGQGFFHDESVGFCRDCGEFVHTFDTPLEYECEAFEER